ncbi:P-loop containing nucleoside triphosphate hydrolase protein [Lophiotrema nucula]|uniref:P-loop containing nucleoside triphosphate hydrolase protein n=1 Tax=Lophiotrema nucula TaxID=690887 RepID=A0A6A5Z3Y5_9PLEO|nr:P-loop containing nucleoside triphosphate hydrolase protein [Lophiotrema nucula]
MARNRGRRGGNKPTPQLANAFAPLDESSTKGELNAHLAERFPPASSSHPHPDLMPTVSATRVNNDIREYYEDSSQNTMAAGSWTKKPEIPSSLEIMEQSYCNEDTIVDVGTKLRPNKAEGAYDSKEEYLGTQYDLLREDAIRPLREAVEHVRAKPWDNEADFEANNNIGLYEPVYITSKIFSTRGLATRVAFSLSRVKKYIRWNQSKRLITGSLVALSPSDDCFRTKCVLATVAARPITGGLDQNPPEIDLFFARAEDEEIDPMKKWIMVEARSSFFEGSRHTLLALQHMMREPFPLSEHLVGAQKIVDPPSYLEKQPLTDLSSLVAMEDAEAFQNVDILHDWPTSASHSLDTSQMKALKRALTKRVAIIQGPPGTGKTYVSVIDLKIKLANMTRDDPPIIVACQTNHALDQLLRHVAEFEPNFIRLGGRSKDKDKIKKRTLYEVKHSMVQPKIPGSLRTQAIIELRKLTVTMQMLLAPLEANKPPLDHQLLVKLGLMTEEQATSLEMDAQYAMGISSDSPGIQMEQWLGRCLVPCDRPLQPDDFGIEFEEEDFEIEVLKELEAEAVAQDDDDFETLRGERSLLSDNRMGRGGGSLRTDDEIRITLRKTQDLTTIPISDRGAIYNYFQRHAKRIILEEFRRLAKVYVKAVLQFKVGNWEQDARILRDQRLIGMTTTGLSKYRPLICSLRPRILLVEEAAETLEAPVAAGCLPSLEQLILVGDHQQLRPHCQVREFEEEPYNFNLSLFERMVLNGVEMSGLKKQRRMIPEIRRLLKPIYGNVLKDHDSVLDVNNRPPVPGMGGIDSYFFTHTELESKDANMSAFNEMEAKMIIPFCDYLLYNGVDAAKITILTFYHGQRKALLKGLKHHANLRNYPDLYRNVVTVDSYQGEENDIVILSLVRSNRRNNIGFLNVDNRVCVALSRAKRGFYIFGNAEMLACESDTWAEVIEILYGKKGDRPTTGKVQRLGYRLPLECTTHGNKIWIEDPEDWGYLNGGCDEDCRCTLPCGHMCMLRCHPFDNSQINCTQKCSKRVEHCGHPCTALCCDPCKCQFCDTRNDGMRAVLKPNPRGGTAVPAKQNPVARIMKAPTPVSSFSTGNSENSSVEQWHKYASGGVKEDDAEFVRKAKEENAKIAAAGGPKLVDVNNSPSKKLVSENTNLLLDLDTGCAMENKAPPRSSYASATASKKGKGKLPVNLMD